MVPTARHEPQPPANSQVLHTFFWVLWWISALVVAAGAVWVLATGWVSPARVVLLVSLAVHVLSNWLRVLFGEWVQQFHESQNEPERPDWLDTMGQAAQQLDSARIARLAYKMALERGVPKDYSNDEAFCKKLLKRIEGVAATSLLRYQLEATRAAGLWDEASERFPQMRDLDHIVHGKPFRGEEEFDQYIQAIARLQDSESPAFTSVDVFRFGVWWAHRVLLLPDAMTHRARIYANTLDDALLCAVSADQLDLKLRAEVDSAFSDAARAELGRMKQRAPSGTEAP